MSDRHARPIVLRATPLLLALLALAAAPALAGDAGRPGVAKKAGATDEALREEAGAILLTARSKNGPTPKAVGAQLAALGPEVAPELFALISSECVGPGGEARRAALLEAFRRLPENVRNDCIRAVALGEVEIADRLRALDVLGAVGGPSALPLLLEISSEITGPQTRSRALVGRLRPTLAAVLAADSGAYRTLERGWADLRPELREIALDAMEDVGRREGLECMGRLLGRAGDADLSLLRRICRAPVYANVDLGASAAFEVQRLMGEQGAGHRRVAARTAGQLHMVDALEDLLKLLDDDDASVRAAAAWSLQRMTGLRLGAAEATRWREWVDQERAWRRDRCSDELTRLHGDRDIALVTLKSLAKRRLYAQEYASRVAGGLRHADTDVRLETCRTLGALRSTACLRDLVETLDDHEPTVQRAADAALRSITGRSSSATAAEWARQLELDIADSFDALDSE